MTNALFNWCKINTACATRDNRVNRSVLGPNVVGCIYSVWTRSVVEQLFHAHVAHLWC